MTTKLMGQLEIDHTRGVIYFHVLSGDDVNTYETVTPLRICSLPKPIPRDSALDITHMFGTSWDKQKKDEVIQ